MDVKENVSNEKRLIDADALCRKFEGELWYDNADLNEIALPLVDDAPTIDAVEVVRCDKCKHFKHDEANDEWYCKKSGANIEYVDSLTHFCSYGDWK